MTLRTSSCLHYESITCTVNNKTELQSLSFSIRPLSNFPKGSRLSAPTRFCDWDKKKKKINDNQLFFKVRICQPFLFGALKIGRNVSMKQLSKRSLYRTTSTLIRPAEPVIFQEIWLYVFAFFFSLGLMAGIYYIPTEGQWDFFPLSVFPITYVETLISAEQ